mmetsp:Transcript_33624/g.89093  ORF Transcript_33624/g.89093 Transcript_33624/m.89093 type:complete len:92 (-) Transcript_33624:169-444(-)
MSLATRVTFIFAGATPLFSYVTQYKSWPEMEGRMGPFGGFAPKPPALSERDQKLQRIKKLKDEAAALEKELNGPPAAAAPASGDLSSWFSE